MSHDPATLDQLRVLLAIVETGSFTAAGRRLNRVQSAVSHAVATMESQFGAPLFERAGGRPALTAAGESVLAVARDVCRRADALHLLAGALAREEEPVLALAVDVLYPERALAVACREFAAAWPAVQLRVWTDTLNSVARMVRDGTGVLGIIGPASDITGLIATHLYDVQLITVVSPSHSLASVPGPVSTQRLAEEVQIVLSERLAGRDTPDQGVLSPRTWRVHEIQTKRLLLCEGLGWGNLPAALVADDLASGRLVQIRPEAWPSEGLVLSLSVVLRPDRVLCPAARWMLEYLKRR